MRRIIGSVLLCLSMAACSSGPSSGEAEAAFLTFMRSNASDDATLSEFDLGDCEQAQGQPGYNCVVSTRVEAQGGRFNEDMSGVYTFGESNGELRVLGVVSRSL